MYFSRLFFNWILSITEFTFQNVVCKTMTTQLFKLRCFFVSLIDDSRYSDAYWCLGDSWFPCCHWLYWSCKIYGGHDRNNGFWNARSIEVTVIVRDIYHLNWNNITWRRNISSMLFQSSTRAGDCRMQIETLFSLILSSEILLIWNLEQNWKQSIRQLQRHLSVFSFTFCRYTVI